MGKETTRVLGKTQALFATKNEGNKNKYINILRDVDMYISNKNNEQHVFRSLKLTDQLLIKSRFPKSGPIYRREVIDQCNDNIIKCFGEFDYVIKFRRQINPILKNEDIIWKY